MTRLAVDPRRVPGWVQGLVEAAEPGTLAPGTIAEGKNFVPTPAGQQRTRGGSRIMLTLKDDNGTPAELDHVCAIIPFTAVGGLVIGYSNTENKHYAYRVDSDMDYVPNEASAIHDLTGTTTTSWNNSSTPARPVMAEVWEKMFLCDATTTFADRNILLSITNSGTVAEQKFQFSGGTTTVPSPFCLEEYNGHLFIAGYGDEGSKDRPEYLRHSFLGKDPGASDGFDALAFNLIGSKGQRITALRKGRGLLLVAKEDEFYRVSGFGKANVGWQFQVEPVDNTQGLGITNPKALIFAEGLWWGVSSQGPIRTDGFSVDLLVGPRKPSWRGINKTEEAWVAYHPERRLVLFGFHPTEAESGRSTTFPWRVWAWDTLRSVWQPDHEFGADIFHASALTTSSAEGPDAAPSSPVTSSETAIGYVASWTNGDATSQTEFWEKDPVTGTWALDTVFAAGTSTTGTLTGRTNHSAYRWRVRHTKNSILSAWDVEAGTLADTLLAVPGQVATQEGNTSTVKIVLTQNSDGTDIRLEREVAVAGGYTEFATYTNQPEGDFDVFDTTRNCGDYQNYKSKAQHSGHTDSAFSGIDNVDLTADCPDV